MKKICSAALRPSCSSVQTLIVKKTSGTIPASRRLAPTTFFLLAITNGASHKTHSIRYSDLKSSINAKQPTRERQT